MCRHKTTFSTNNSGMGKSTKRSPFAQGKDILSLQKIYFRKYNEFLKTFPEGHRNEYAFAEFNNWFDRVYLKEGGSGNGSK